MLLNSFACIMCPFWVILDNSPAPCHQARDKSPTESHCSESNPSPKPGQKGALVRSKTKIWKYNFTIMCFFQSCYGWVDQTEWKDLFIKPRWTQLHKKASSKSLVKVSVREWPSGKKTVKQRVPWGQYKKGKNVHNESVRTEQHRQGYHLQLQLGLALF